MSTILDPRDADRLAKLCGLFSSDYDGERASAAAAADRLLRSRGLTWAQVISIPTSPDIVEDMIATALSRPDLLDAWEEGFIRGIQGRQYLTRKQTEKLRAIAERVGL